MPKKSSKSKSKRTTLKQKYKVVKKVKEHGRKLRKEARKSGKKNKAPPDPGLPKQWPFKQELIAELEEKRRLILEAEAAKKAERKRARVGVMRSSRMQCALTYATGQKSTQCMRCSTVSPSALSTAPAVSKAPAS